ncbi:diaminopimelate decarboxylase [Babesia caballi]|uniref:Diaminopimelate decarboxylase n=1 Tax=Babesia caballi TaxID=5871 RepID=A0AAV4LZZ3_BABCB|nr:diaminopimelate decarboxylase [Babesia caballi]
MLAQHHADDNVGVTGVEVGAQVLPRRVASGSREAYLEGDADQALRNGAGPQPLPNASQVVRVEVGSLLVPLLLVVGEEGVVREGEVNDQSDNPRAGDVLGDRRRLEAVQIHDAPEGVQRYLRADGRAELDNDVVAADAELLEADDARDSPHVSLPRVRGLESGEHERGGGVLGLDGVQDVDVASEPNVLPDHAQREPQQFRLVNLRFVGLDAHVGEHDDLQLDACIVDLGDEKRELDGVHVADEDDEGLHRAPGSHLVEERGTYHDDMCPLIRLMPPTPWMKLFISQRANQIRSWDGCPEARTSSLQRWRTWQWEPTSEGAGDQEDAEGDLPDAVGLALDADVEDVDDPVEQQKVLDPDEEAQQPVNVEKREGRKKYQLDEERDGRQDYHVDPEQGGAEHILDGPVVQPVDGARGAGEVPRLGVAVAAPVGDGDEPEEELQRVPEEQREARVVHHEGERELGDSRAAGKREPTHADEADGAQLAPLRRVGRRAPDGAVDCRPKSRRSPPQNQAVLDGLEHRLEHLEDVEGDREEDRADDDRHDLVRPAVICAA